MARKKVGKQKDSVADTIRTVVYAILIAVVFRTFLFQPFWIPSGSMKETLLVGDYLFISKFSYGYSKHSFPWSLAPFDGRIFGSEPERGDVVVFKHPKTGDDFIKRVVGMPGDEIQMRGGVLFINGEESRQEKSGEFIEPLIAGQNRCLSKEERDGELVCIKDLIRETFPDGNSHLILNSDSNLVSGTDNTGIYTVPADHYFFMGDNRDNSNDSRQGVGFVPYENLVGRAELVAISSDGPFYEVWNWRFGRFLTAIR
jgi:signal peptidase I